MIEPALAYMSRMTNWTNSTNIIHCHQVWFSCSSLRQPFCGMETARCSVCFLHPLMLRLSFASGTSFRY